MAHFIGLDLSIRSTGFASWSPDHERPVSGTWELAAGLEWTSRAYCRLQRNLMGLHRVEPITDILYEDSLPAERLHGHTNRETLKAAVGLTEHVESFAEAIGAKVRYTNQSTWRRHFLGAMKRGTKTPDLKRMAMERCRELGFEPTKHDEAEALGILDYEISLAGITPPWRMQHVLTEQLVGGGRR
jgi:hypothetical protein